MNLKWLDDLVTLERERSFVRAAALRHVTQPQLSRRIRQLEIWAGATLVQRDAGMVLTSAGQALVEAARTSTLALAQAKERIRDHAQGASGLRATPWLTVATGRSLSRTATPIWLSKLRSTLKPATSTGIAFRLKLITGALGEVAQALVQGRADVLLCFAHPRLPMSLDERSFEFITLGADELVAVSCPSVPMGQKPQHALPGTARKPTRVLDYASSLSMWHVLSDALALDPQPRHLLRMGECDFAEAIHEQVKQGVCAAWLPLSVVRGDLASGALVRADPSASAIGFEHRLYRRRGDCSPFLEAVWRASL